MGLTCHVFITTAITAFAIAAKTVIRGVSPTLQDFDRNMSPEPYSALPPDRRQANRKARVGVFASALALIFTAYVPGQRGTTARPNRGGEGAVSASLPVNKSSRDGFAASKVGSPFVSQTLTDGENRDGRDQQTSTPPAPSPSGAHESHDGRTIAVDATVSKQDVGVLDADQVADATDRKSAGQRDLLVGKWCRYFFGQRTLTIRRDGSATMNIEPDGLWAVAFGDSIKIDIEWRTENGCIIYAVTGGTPADKVKAAKKLWGDHWNEKILELSPSKLLLLGEDGETTYEWKRLDSDDR